MMPVIGVKNFAKVIRIEIPAHDGLGATTSLSAAGLPAPADTDGIRSAVQDTGEEQVLDILRILHDRMDLSRHLPDSPFLPH